jgi:hypothetical protein
MSVVMQLLESILPALVLVFTASNLASMGLQVKLPEVRGALRSRTSRC